MQKKNTFYAMLARMKYIKRWALMRNAEEENISEHSLEVAILSHALAFIGNTRLSKDLNADRIAMLGVYHDCTEIITGDMPTPIKYENPTIQDAYIQIEKTAAFRLLNMLPDDLRTSYESYFTESSLDAYEKLIVKAADKLSAYIKCIEEEKAGNAEFKSAKQTIAKAITELHCEEADIFVKEFLPAYELTLDELN